MGDVESSTGGQKMAHEDNGSTLLLTQAASPGTALGVHLFSSSPRSPSFLGAFRRFPSQLSLVRLRKHPWHREPIKRQAAGPVWKQVLLLPDPSRVTSRLEARSDCWIRDNADSLNLPQLVGRPGEVGNFTLPIDTGPPDIFGKKRRKNLAPVPKSKTLLA